MKKFSFVLILLAVLLAFTGCTKVDENTEPENVPEKTEETTAAEEHEILNLVLLGINNEDTDNEKDTREKKASAMKVLSLDSADQSVKVISVSPWIITDVDGKAAYLSEAYDAGKEKLAMEALSNVLDMDLENYISFDYEALRLVVDEIGGVEIEVTDNDIAQVKDSSIHGPAGTYTLNGKQALVYICNLVNADQEEQRMERLTKVIKAVYTNVKESSTLEIASLVAKVFPYVHTNLKLDDITDLAKNVLDLDLGNVETLSLPKASMIARKNVIKHGVVVNSFTELAEAANNAVNAYDSEYKYEASDAIKALDETVAKLVSELN